MINIIVEPALLLGAIFAIVMIFLYGLRFVNPELATDWDIFITTLGIVYSSILIIHGWKNMPLPSVFRLATACIKKRIWPKWLMCF